MADMSVSLKNERYVVVVRGQLGRSDLSSLEYLCGPALEHRAVPLDIHLEAVNRIDATARAFLDRLAARGAVLHSASP
jgi:hypothetical protein